MNKFPLRWLASAAALVILCSSFLVNAQDSLEKWNEFDFASRSIKQADIADMALYDLKLLRGIVFGRHGRVFKDVAIKKYLATQAWYKPNPEFKNSVLNDVERRNLDLIRDAEASKHEKVEPGDMRYYRKRLLTRKHLGNHSKTEWTVLHAEIEAIHGKRFDDQPWLQQYFDERYWYQPNTNYDAKQLSAIERKNMQTIASAQKTQRKLALAPGDMELFENRLITENMLKGLSLHELRLLRNEVYARHGRQFRAPWLQQYFWSQPWYEQNDDFRDEQLTGSDKQNVETIVKYENRIHDELGTKPLTQALLGGLFVEDTSKMRQEIYARRGKVFKEPWLQKYFSSFDWYKPDPQFTEDSLTEIEKLNIATLLAYEKKAVSSLSVIEG
ncbi:MAG TPA: YARHG domain-containing protein [Pyrinomonadaceae bacterium]|nr:YARHG domain-containing protein [Pyrinomonadaceae bacterium]